MYTCEIFSCKQALVPARAIDTLHPKSMELCSQEQKELWKRMHMEKTTVKNLALLDKNEYQTLHLATLLLHKKLLQTHNHTYSRAPKMICHESEVRINVNEWKLCLSR